MVPSNSKDVAATLGVWDFSPKKPSQVAESLCLAVISHPGPTIVLLAPLSMIVLYAFGAGALATVLLASLFI